MVHLKEIDIIRCWVILLVIAVHTLAPFTDAWSLPSYWEPNKVLWWVGKLFYSGMLETFVFISGYVFATKRMPVILGDKLSFLLKKTKRLYFPCIVFGFLMTVIFSKGDLQTHIVFIFNGSYHLWFLPMLLWCFILEIFVVSHITKYKIPILTFIAILPYPSLPMFFNNALYFLLFFHLGSYVCRRKETIVSFVEVNFVKILSVYLFVFIMHTLWSDYIYHIGEISKYIKALLLLCGHLLRLISAVFIVMIYYWLGHELQKNKLIYNNAKIIAKYSMGIYLFQELILRIIYYKSSVCADKNYFFLFVVYGMTFVISLGITIALSKNSFTKRIIS